VQKDVKQKQNPIEPAKRIVQERVLNGRREFLVLFHDNEVYWCSYVTNPLLRDWRLRNSRRNRRRRK